MNVPVYCMTEAQLRTEDGTMYNSYGIACVVNGKEVNRIPDISCYKSFVENMVTLFNLCSLSCDRLKHAVIDLLP